MLRLAIPLRRRLHRVMIFHWNVDLILLAVVPESWLGLEARPSRVPAEITEVVLKTVDDAVAAGIRPHLGLLAVAGVGRQGPPVAGSAS